MARAPSITKCPHTRRHILYKGRKRFKGNEGNFLKRGERSFSSSRTGHPGGRPGGAKEVATDGCQDTILGKRGGCFPFERAGRTAPNGGGLTGSGRSSLPGATASTAAVLRVAAVGVHTEVVHTEIVHTEIVHTEIVHTEIGAHTDAR